jgi:hypothetical protein
MAVIAYALMSSPRAETPTFSPAPGTFTSAQEVTLSDSITGATIFYTSDGSTPTTASKKYAGPINVNTSETLAERSFKCYKSPLTFCADQRLKDSHRDPLAPIRSVLIDYCDLVLRVKP